MSKKYHRITRKGNRFYIVWRSIRSQILGLIGRQGRIDSFKNVKSIKAAIRILKKRKRKNIHQAIFFNKDSIPYQINLKTLTAHAI